MVTHCAGPLTRAVIAGSELQSKQLCCSSIKLLFRMNTGRSYADATVNRNEVLVTGGWDGKQRHQGSEILKADGVSGWKLGFQLTSKR